MTGNRSGGSTPPLLLLLLLLSLQLIPGLSENPSSGKKADNNSNSRSNTGLTVLLVCLGVAFILLFSFFLYKMWQKKKREEQHARLLKLFEEDDGLEVELGLRD